MPKLKNGRYIYKSGNRKVVWVEGGEKGMYTARDQLRIRSIFCFILSIC